MDELLLLSKILKARGLDAATYRSAFLLRRAGYRARRLGLENTAQYAIYLKRHPEEFHEFLDSLSINVTSFFRDPQAYLVFQTMIIPHLISTRKERKLRIWSAGCAGGQEPYSIAMLLWDSVKKGAGRWDVKIFATDMNEKWLEKGKKGEYSEKEMEGVKPAFLEEFFQPKGGEFEVKPFLRKWVHFFKHDLADGGNLGKMDVVFCRNVLIYMDKEAGVKLISNFAENLKEDGFLVIGGSELLSSRVSHFFKPVNLHGRAFQKI